LRVRKFIHQRTSHQRIVDLTLLALLVYPLHAPS
jgi:hypothetical protein